MCPVQLCVPCVHGVGMLANLIPSPPAPFLARFEHVRKSMIEHLRNWGYEVYWKVLDTKTQGLPQSRPRFYLVAIRAWFNLNANTFNFPPPIEAVPLGRLLEGRDAAAAGKPLRFAQMQRVQAARVKLESAGYLPEATDAVVDVGSSAKWSHVMRGCSPCLTASRAKTGGHYLVAKRRLMTEREMQGIPDGRFDYEMAKVSQSKFLHAVGNAMSSNVVARILARALPAAGLNRGRILVEPEADALLKRLTEKDDD